MNSSVNQGVNRDLLGDYSGAYIPGMNLAQRLDKAMEIRRIDSQSALSRASGIPQPTINRILKGTTTRPDFGTIQALALTLDVTIEWLVDGVGPGPDSPINRQKRPLPDDKGNVRVWENPGDLEAGDEDDDRIWVDRYDYHFSAGDGLIQWEVREKRALPFNAAFFRAKGVNPKDCKLCVSRGDSMAPYLFDRDVFMVHTTSTNILDGDVYAFVLNDEPLVKQIFKEPDGSLVLHSYNPAYPDKHVPRDMLEYVHMVGRVIYRSG